MLPLHHAHKGRMYGIPEQTLNIFRECYYALSGNGQGEVFLRPTKRRAILRRQAHPRGGGLIRAAAMPERAEEKQ